MSTPDNQDLLEITLLLRKVEQGEDEAKDRLFEAVYHYLRTIARRAMSRERPEHTLQPTELVNEAFVTLFRKSIATWENRGHFFAQMARTMRHRLIDHARKPHPAKVPVEPGMAADCEELDELLLLDQAINRLAAYDPDFERIVELRFYGGLTEEETARELGLSTRHTRRKWQAARLLLLEFLNKPGNIAA